MNLRWFVSKSTRHASAMHRHVRNLINSQRDLLSPQALGAMQEAAAELNAALQKSAGNEELQKQMKHLDVTADKWLLRHPHPAWRENVEVFLVALAVAMGIRTFLLQPFKIPTGSMQPTLYGVTSENLLARPDFKVPTGWARVKEWFGGVSYVDLRTPGGGRIESIAPPVGITIFNLWQKVVIGGRTHILWFPPDYGQETLARRADLLEQQGRHYQAGEQVIHLRVKAGDHLFVDRLTFNFRRARRGEIVVFQTTGISPEGRMDPLRRWPEIPSDQFYIKRLVALGGEKVKIGADRHLVINDERLDAATPRFENVYSDYVPGTLYSGHRPIQSFADGRTVSVRPKHFMVMGDNTESSLDSRYFGDVDERAIIGKSWFVYWPIAGGRFGLGYR